MAFQPTYLMLPKPHGSSTVITRPPAADDVHRNGSVEHERAVDDRRQCREAVGR